MKEEYEKLQKQLVVIGKELYRFQGVFMKAIHKLEFEDQDKYTSQFQWFSKKVTKALEEAGLRLVDLDGQLYDPGMAVTPLNIEDFDTDDILYIMQTVEPIIMKEDVILKTGTVLLGRIEQ